MRLSSNFKRSAIERAGFVVLATLIASLPWSLQSSASKFDGTLKNDASTSESSRLPEALESPTPCCNDNPHLLAASYYSVKNGLSAKLLLNNKGPHPIEVKPTLFSMGGKHYEVAPVTVEGNSFQLLDMSGWVAAAGPQFREGSIQVFHLGPDLVIGAQVYLEDDAHSLAFEEKCAEPARFHSSQLRGMWWLPSQEGEVLLALSNTSDSAVMATAHADGQRPTREASTTVALLPHETRLLHVQEDLFGNGSGAMSRLGGISVEHNGPAGAVLARGFAQESGKGYSLAVQFSDPQGAKSSAYQGAGLRLGIAGGEALTPVAVAYNAGTQEATVTGRMPYTTSDGGTAEVSLREVRLRPGEAREIDVAGAVREAGVPADISAAGLEFEYSTTPGSVQVIALSVGTGGNQVFRMPLWDVPAQRSGTGGYPWRIEGSSSTFVYLKNTTDRPQEYTLQMSHEGGFYVMGLKTVGPHQTLSIDVRALRDRQAPDINGATIPLTAERGQVVWSVRGPDLLGMLGRSEQVDEVTGVSSNYACMYCCGNSFSSASLDPTSSVTAAVGETAQFIAKETDVTCYGAQLQPYPVSGNNLAWNSHDTTAATINQSGTATGAAPGSTGIDATWTAYACSGFYNQSFTVHSPTTTLYVRPILSGNATIWWFNDYDSPDTNHYPIVSTLTASASSGGSYTYQILVGSDKAGLGPDLASSYVSSSNQVEVKSRKGSDNQNDIGITVTVNGRTSAIFYMTVRRPKYLRQEGISYSGTQNPDFPYGFLTVIRYSVFDNLNTQLPYDLPVNEYFTTGIARDYSGTDWSRSDPNGYPAPQAAFADNLSVFQSSPFGIGGWTPAPQSPGTPLSSTSIIHFHQQFWVGTFNPGTGILVQDNTCRLYLDHGAHEDVQHP